MITSPGAVLRDAFQGALRLLLAQTNPAAKAYALASSGLTSNGRRAVWDTTSIRVPEGQALIGTNGKLNPNATLGRKIIYNGQEYLADARRLDRRGLPVGVPSGIQREHLRCDGAQLVLRFARLSGQYGYYQKFGAGALYRASEGRLSGQEVAEGGRQHVVCALQQQQRQLERRIGFLDGQHLRVLCADAPDLPGIHPRRFGPHHGGRQRLSRCTTTATRAMRA